jgi:ribosomal protein L29
MSELSKQEIPELQKSLADKRDSLRVFRFEGAGSRTRNVKAGNTLRKEIARIMTELRSREIASNVKKA